MAFLLGLDIGSSSVKAALLDAESGRILGSVASPDTELPIHSPEPGFAEQDPEIWWEHAGLAARALGKKFPEAVKEVKAIGIAYQMHGLVMTDRAGRVLHPAVIWCDSRGVAIGEKAFRELGETRCLSHLLNSPGNFTASKLKWIRDNRPAVFGKIDKIMLPGDYIAFRMTGRISTTITGLSEGILWDFKEKQTARMLLDYYGIPEEFLPEVLPVFSPQGELSADSAEHLGLPAGIPVTYRAGDQPNNAFSLGVLNPGELAATAGTSGVVYAVSDKPQYDPLSRVNTFVHVNHSRDRERYGTLLCLNGCGIAYSWLRKELFAGAPGDYDVMNKEASSVPAGAAGLSFYPFGNGAERSLENRNPGAHIEGLQFNIHSRAHILRSAQEGIAFALNYGIEVMRDMGMKIDTVKAGRANLFLSPLFREAFSTVTGAVVELYNTDGAGGAARGAGLGSGLFKNEKEAFTGLQLQEKTEPQAKLSEAYKNAYQTWLGRLERTLGGDYLSGGKI